MASADVQMVCKVLLDEDVFGADAAASESVRAMMVSALPHAEGGHAYQQEVLKHCHGILLETKTLADGNSTQLGEEAAAAAGRIAEAEQVYINTSIATQQAKEAVASATAALEDQENSVAKAKADEASIRKTAAKDLQARVGLAAEKAAIESSLAVLKADNADSTEDSQNKLLQMLAQAGAEPALIEACPAALAVPMAERGDFDKQTIDMAAEVLSEYQAFLAEQLSEAERSIRDVQAEALGCEALREVEEEKKETFASKLQAAIDSAEARQAEQETAQKAVSAREAERSDFLIRQVLAQDRARKAMDAMAAVERLRNPVTDSADSATQDVDMVESKDTQTAVEPSKVEPPMGDLLRHATELGA